MPRLIQFRTLLRQQGVTLGLIAFLTAVFLVQTLVGHSFTGRYWAIPAEIVSAWDGIRSGNPIPGAWEQMFTLFSAALLHGDFGHLAGNMVFLWIFAAIASELLGARAVIPVFVFTALCGSICHVALNADSPIPSLGASGAVMGFEGLYLGMAVRWRLPDPHIWPIARPVAPGRLALVGIFGLTMDFMGFIGGEVGVAYGAHLGGFIGGLFLGSFIVRMPRVAMPR
ncbi:rhomboid family intramembrane serine protease [Akkermansiaceae bacterium]|nr:rhomboid family intramembrane serine protease [Akkermansiaceae bacterium]